VFIKFYIKPYGEYHNRFGPVLVEVFHDCGM